jgi:hypothetical protein
VHADRVQAIDREQARLDLPASSSAARAVQNASRCPAEQNLEAIERKLP